MFPSHSVREKYHSSFLSQNDIANLSRFFQSAFNHFRNYHSSSEESYLESINIIHDCYCLILIKSGTIFFNDQYASLFQSSRNYKKYPETIGNLSLALSEMINAITSKIKLVDYPWFNPDYTLSIKKILGDKISCLYGETGQEIQNLRERILKFK